MKIEFLIIGQGLAGSVLALKLLEKGYTIRVVDPGLPNATSIAGGILDPVSGQRLKKNWMAAELIPSSIRFYQFWEKKLGASFFYCFPLIRLFSTDYELEQWKKIKNHPDITLFNPTVVQPSSQFKHIHSAISFSKTGHVNATLFLSAVKNYLISSNSLISEKINYGELKQNANEISWKNFQAKAIVFCEGHQTIQNPWFSWVPTSLVKGEVLQFASDQLSKTELFNQMEWLIPEGGNKFKFGATFHRNFSTPSPSRLGYEELTPKLAKFVGEPILIITHQAGLRLFAQGSKPIIGQHPTSPKFYLFSGLGSKGFMSAPYCADQLIANIENRSVINKDIEVRRFVKGLFGNK